MPAHRDDEDSGRQDPRSHRSGGKVIREIVEKTGAKIDIQDDARSRSPLPRRNRSTRRSTGSSRSRPNPRLVTSTKHVVKVMDFGAFVNFFGAKDGLVHISQLAQRRCRKTTDVVKEGDKVKVKLLGFDERGKTRLSMKVVDQETARILKPSRRRRRAAAEARRRRRIARL